MDLKEIKNRIWVVLDKFREEKVFPVSVIRNYWNLSEQIFKAEILKLRKKNENSKIEISDLQNRLEKAIHFIKNISKYWLSGNIEIKKRIQRLVFPGGIYLKPSTRQYLTPEVNSLFRTVSELSRVSEDVKKIPH